MVKFDTLTNIDAKKNKCSATTEKDLQVDMIVVRNSKSTDYYADNNVRCKMCNNDMYVLERAY